MLTKAHVTYRVLTVPDQIVAVNFDLIYDAGYEVEGSTPHAFPISGYVFLFWNLGSSPILSTNVKIPHNVFTATAWYIPNTGGFGITTHAFSETQNKLLTVSAIQKVDPSTAWPGGNDVTPSSTKSIGITAQTPLEGELFDTWVAFSGNPTINATLLTIPVNGDTYAIAFYRALIPSGPTLSSHTYLVDIHPTGVTVSGEFSEPADLSAVQRVANRDMTGTPMLVDRLNSAQIQPAPAPAQTKKK
jgi:hypothetical protein